MRNQNVNRLEVAFARFATLRVAVGWALRSKAIIASVTLFGLLVIASQSHAALIPTVIYQQDFNSGLPSGQMTQFGTGSVSSSASAALLSGSSSMAYLTNDTFTTEDFTIDVDLNQLNGGAGNTVSGITVGNRVFFIFPGYSGGAFNMHAFDPNTGGLGTLLSTQDINMGFTPAQGIYHHFQLDVDPISKNIDVRVYQNDNLLSTPFLYQDVADAGFVPGKIGFYIVSQAHDTLFDNLTVTALRPEPAPEPSSVLLLGLGLVGLSLRRKTRRG